MARTTWGTRARVVAAGVVAGAAALGVAAQTPSTGLPVLPSSAGSDRAAVTTQRQAIEQAAQQQALACQSRFAVTACLEDMRAQQREALAPWRQRELQLNEDSRHDRATARAEALQRKAQNRSAAVAGDADKQPHKSLAAAVPTPPPPTGPAPAAAATQAPDAPLPVDARRLKATKREQQASQRVQAGAKRAAAVARVQERVNKRLTQAKKPGQPAP